jgi:hypothetical protein
VTSKYRIGFEVKQKQLEGHISGTRGAIRQHDTSIEGSRQGGDDGWEAINMCRKQDTVINQSISFIR